MRETGGVSDFRAKLAEHTSNIGEKWDVSRLRFVFLLLHD